MLSIFSWSLQAATQTLAPTFHPGHVPLATVGSCSQARPCIQWCSSQACSRVRTPADTGEVCHFPFLSLALQSHQFCCDGGIHGPK